jgi:short-subunit dehydrogenase
MLRCENLPGTARTAAGQLHRSRACPAAPPFTSVDSPFDDLKDRVVVLTGASSGIGRAAAHAFARCGAKLVLAARRENALRETSRECSDLGAEALPVPTDVTRVTAVEALARAAIDAFGRIDVWINNAGVGLFGAFTDAAIDAHRRVVETNLFGAMHGAAAVLPIFQRQGQGVMITNISVGGFVPTPFAAAYTASKFGLRGWMASLRGEFGDQPRIQLCSLFPAIVDTPGFLHGANVSGHALRPPPAPLLRPERVADAMVSLALRPRAELAIGWPTRPAQAGYAVAPRATEKLVGALFRRVVRRGRPIPRTTGNLFVPVEAGTSPSGGWREEHRRSRAVTGLALVGLAAGVAYWAATKRRAARSHDRPRIEAESNA